METPDCSGQLVPSRPEHIAVEKLALIPQGIVWLPFCIAHLSHGCCCHVLDTIHMWEN